MTANNEWQPFVYIWIHKPTSKWYIGSRTANGCHPGDGYISSSEILTQAVNEKPEEWERHILKTGSPIEMLAYEKQLLNEFDAINNPDSLNQTNGGGKIVLKEKVYRQQMGLEIKEIYTNYVDEVYSEALDLGMTLWEDIVSTLNNIVIQDGQIRIDDKRIWNGYLHRWSNNDWLLMLLAIEYQADIKPECFASYHIDTFIEARDILLKYINTVPRVLDIKEPGMEHKRIAWKSIQAMREALNNINNISIENELHTRPARELRGLE